MYTWADKEAFFLYTAAQTVTWLCRCQLRHIQRREAPAATSQLRGAWLLPVNIQSILRSLMADHCSTASKKTTASFTIFTAATVPRSDPSRGRKGNNFSLIIKYIFKMLSPPHPQYFRPSDNAHNTELGWEQGQQSYHLSLHFQI